MEPVRFMISHFPSGYEAISMLTNAFPGDIFCKCQKRFYSQPKFKECQMKLILVMLVYLPSETSIFKISKSPLLEGHFLFIKTFVNKNKMERLAS